MTREPMICTGYDFDKDARVITLVIPATWEIHFPGKFMRMIYLTWWLARMPWKVYWK